MITLLEAQNTLAILGSQLSNAQDLLSNMERDPAAYFEDEMKELYDQQLNEIYSEQFDNFPFSLGDPCDWIEENQPTDYRVGFADFECDYTSFAEYEEVQGQIEELENEITEIEEELALLEEEENI